MKLTVPLVSQPKHSPDCGVASLAMILKYYKVPYTYEQLRKDVKVFSYGTFGPQLGLYLLKNGFDVNIVTLHPALFNIKHTFKNNGTLIKHLDKVGKNLKGIWNKNAIKFFKEFLKAGGTLTPQVPNAKIIATEIKHNRPIISSLTHWFLFDSKLDPKFTLHFNVITGVDKNKIYVNDPDWGKPFGGKHKHNLEHYLYAIHSSAQSSVDNACLLLIKKR